MECRYAYRKNGVPYILCKCLGEPKSDKMQDTAHCMCGHQRFCAKVQDCSLLPSWVECRVRKDKEARDAAAMSASIQKAAEAKINRESRSKKRKI